MTHYNCCKNINSDPRFIQKSWFCEKCSKRFYKFLIDFIKLNTELFEKIERLKEQNIKSVNTNYKNEYIEIISELFEIQIFINNILENDTDSFTFSSLNKICKLKKLKFPYLSTDNISFNNFFDSKKKNFKGIDYLEYIEINNYIENIPEDNQRNDIKSEGFYFGEDDYNYLNNKYHIENNLDYRDDILYADDIYDYSDYLMVNLYSYEKSIILNYLDNLYCNDCRQNFRYIERISESVYIEASIYTFIFNLLIEIPFLSFLDSESKDIKDYKFIFEKKLNELRKYWSGELYNHNWKGYLKYCEKLNFIPEILKEAGIDSKHYYHRKSIYFNDIICGHPKASHGWFYESINDMITLGALN